jgi:hypothetical protein
MACSQPTPRQSTKTFWNSLAGERGNDTPMSAMGHKQTLGLNRTMSALPPKADISAMRFWCSMLAASMTAPPNSSTRITSIRGAISVGIIVMRTSPAFRRRVVCCSTTLNSTARCQSSRAELDTKSAAKTQLIAPLLRRARRLRRSFARALLRASFRWSLLPAQIQRAVDDTDVTIGLWKIPQHTSG